MVDIRVYVDWDDDGDFGDYGEDVTERVMARTDIRVRYGRDQARALSPVAPGEAVVELDNRSRDYSPDNAASPLADQVLPGRRMKIVATRESVTHNAYAGNLDDYEVLPSPERRSVAVSCLDALGRMRGTRISTALHQGLQTGDAIGVILDEVGWPTELRALNHGATTVPWFWANHDDAYDLVMQLVDSEGPGALITVDGDGRIVFRDRHHRLTSPASTTVQATIRDGGAEPLMSDFAYSTGWRDIVNRVDLAVPNRRPDVDFSVVWSAQGRWSIADGETVELQAALSDPVTQIDTLVEGVDYALLSGVVSIGRNRNSGQRVTLSITAIGGPAVVADVQIRAVRLVTLGSIVVSGADSTSIARYGRRTLPDLRQPVWAGWRDAQALANLIVGQRAERLPTVTVTIRGDGHPSRMTQQLSRDLSDRIRIVEAETATDADFFIEQIEHRIGRAGHETRLGCERVPTQVPDVFRLGAGVLGTNRLGRTGLDDPATIFRLGMGMLGTNVLGH